MIYFNKFILLLMISTMAFLASGCDKIEEKVADSAPTPSRNYPIQLALDSMGDSFQESVTNLSITQHVNSGELPDKAVVTIEESDLQDDSVAAEKTIFTMSYQGDKWQIINRVKTQRCWPERGNKDFSEQPCN
ncbi:hypothetical protein VK86_04160 [Moellerella wisconsensis]|nr:hypothetical protein VK86_04160 [Moellerella wisconsensis]